MSKREIFSIATAGNQTKAEVDLLYVPKSEKGGVLVQLELFYNATAIGLQSRIYKILKKNVSKIINVIKNPIQL